MNEGQKTMLQFDWETVDGTTISSVQAIGAQALDDGSLECEEIALVLGAKAVVIRVNDDTDEVIVSLEDFAPSGADWQSLDQLNELVSRRVGWCWVGRNYRGYLDSFTLAVDGIDPAYNFTGMASTLQVSRLTPIEA